MLLLLAALAPPPLAKRCCSCPRGRRRRLQLRDVSLQLVEARATRSHCWLPSPPLPPQPSASTPTSRSSPPVASAPLIPTPPPSPSLLQPARLAEEQRPAVARRHSGRRGREGAQRARGQMWQARRRSRRSRVELRFVAPRRPSRSSQPISRGFCAIAGARAGFLAYLARLLKKLVLERLKKPCPTGSISIHRRKKRKSSIYYLQV